MNHFATRYPPGMGMFVTGLIVGLLLLAPLLWLAVRGTAQRIRRLEQRSRTNERLAELGGMTGGLAHEIKNPLSSINLNIQLLQEDLDSLIPDADAGRPADVELLRRSHRRLGALGGEIDRLREILEDFLRFAGRMKLHRQPTNIDRMVDDLIDFFGPQAHAAGVQLRAELRSGDGEIPIDAGLLKQALLNLMINATKAMQEARARARKEASGGEPKAGGGNELIIRTEQMQPRRLAGEADEAGVVIHVIDMGPGIPVELREKVFEPYYSTSKGGTGLGLPTARRIVEEHGGWLTVHSEVGKGSDFAIHLPADDADNAER